MGKRRSFEAFVLDSNLKHNNKFDYSKVEWKGVLDKVIITCPIHGDFEQKPNDHLTGYGCNKCRPNTPLTQTEFLKRVYKIHGDRYDYSLTIYKNRVTKIDILCYKHGLFQPRAENHLRGTGCPKCKSSQGELKITSLLNELNIEFVFQKTYENCKSNKGRILRYDFYIPSYNLLIEYQGEQHYQIPYKTFGGLSKNQAEDLFKRTQENDLLKKEFALDNEIGFLEISFDQYKNIDNILKQRLNIL